MTSVGWLSSIALAISKSSTARSGSLRCNAAAARIVGSQYLWTSVSSGNSLSSSTTSFSAPAVSPCVRQSQCRHGPHIAVRGQLHSGIGVGPGKSLVTRYRLAQCRRSLIGCGSLLGGVVLGGIHRPPGQSARVLQLPMPTFRVCFICKEEVFRARLAHRRRSHLCHFGLVALQKSQCVTVREQAVAFQLTVMDLLVRCLRLIQPVQVCVGGGEVGVADPIVRICGALPPDPRATPSRSFPE